MVRIEHNNLIIYFGKEQNIHQNLRDFYNDDPKDSIRVEVKSLSEIMVTMLILGLLISKNHN